MNDESLFNIWSMFLLRDLSKVEIVEMKIINIFYWLSKVIGYMIKVFFFFWRLFCFFFIFIIWDKLLSWFLGVFNVLEDLEMVGFVVSFFFLGLVIIIEIIIIVLFKFIVLVRIWKIN